VKRRAFITLLGGAAVARPFAARAQQAAKAARIGYLAFRSPISADEAFLKGLAELGWIEGQNIVIERRFAQEIPSSSRVQLLNWSASGSM